MQVSSLLSPAEDTALYRFRSNSSFGSFVPLQETYSTPMEMEHKSGSRIGAKPLSAELGTQKLESEDSTSTIKSESPVTADQGQSQWGSLTLFPSFSTDGGSSVPSSLPGFRPLHPVATPPSINSDSDEIPRPTSRRKSQAATPSGSFRCSWCDKLFRRSCDLTKHVKSHERPWKCPKAECKYYKKGWPSEKERDRHFNDMHSSSPEVYQCSFSPCPYSSKRESNLKQHMEKVHGWEYVRKKAKTSLMV